MIESGDSAHPYSPFYVEPDLIDLTLIPPPPPVSDSIKVYLEFLILFVRWVIYSFQLAVPLYYFVFSIIYDYTYEQN